MAVEKRLMRARQVWREARAELELGHDEGELAAVWRESVQYPERTSFRGGMMSISKAPAAGPATSSRQVLFVQGGGKNVHDGWDNRLVASLQRGLGTGYTVRYPRMPNEGNPAARAWQAAIAAELQTLGDGAIVVAHSVGAAIALDHLAQAASTRNLSGIFLLAVPFIGDGGWPSDDLRPTKEVASRLVQGPPLHLYFGGHDQTVPIGHGRLFEAAFPRARITFLDGRDHQLNDDLSEVARDIEQLAGGKQPAPERHV